MDTRLSSVPLGYDSADCIKKVAGKYRELNIPCDTMHFDIDYMDGYRVFTWNEKDYGDPAETIQELADDGFKQSALSIRV